MNVTWLLDVTIVSVYIW